MSAGLKKTPEQVSRLLDAIPSFIFLVDRDVRVQGYNSAAKALVRPVADGNPLPRGGEALQCIHVREHPDGCGYSPACRHCVIRQSVTHAFEGTHVVRHRARVEIETDGRRRELHVMVTASLLADGTDPQVLLLMEDISPLMELQRILPICIKCKKVCVDAVSWMQIESFFQRHFDLDFSHGYCPECGKQEMKKLDANLRRRIRRRTTARAVPD